MTSIEPCKSESTILPPHLHNSRNEGRSFLRSLPCLHSFCRLRCLLFACCLLCGSSSCLPGYSHMPFHIWMTRTQPQEARMAFNAVSCNKLKIRECLPTVQFQNNQLKISSCMSLLQYLYTSHAARLKEAFKEQPETEYFKSVKTSHTNNHSMDECPVSLETNCLLKQNDFQDRECRSLKMIVVSRFASFEEWEGSERERERERDAH